MPQCDQCGDETLMPTRMINDEMQRLCGDCAVEARENAQDGAHGGADYHDEPPIERERNAPVIQQDAWNVSSIRDEWKSLNVRLPDHILRRFNSYHKRLDYELTAATTDREFKKDRHYKPLVIAFGLMAVKDMDAKEVEQALDLLEEDRLVE